MRLPIIDATLRWLEIILAERFGHAWHLARVDAGICLHLAGAECAIYFDALCGGFNESQSDQLFTQWDAAREGWRSILGGSIPAPGVSDLPRPLIESRGSDHVIHYDILGLTYWALARVEEIDCTGLDSHDRFAAISSHAYKHGYLERPIVDEWLNVLSQVVQRNWPSIELKQHNFSIKVSHDVDEPSRYAFKNWKNIGRTMMSETVLRRNMKSAVFAPWIKLSNASALHPQDPANTFDWIMDVSERHGLTSAFYFICGRTTPKFDSDYDLEHPIILRLLNHIHERGHEIGLHPSYGSYRTSKIIKTEASRLRQVAEEVGIKQSEWGGRMHFLQWQQPTTLRAWAEAPMDYDSSLGYADLPGFRCGTCHEFPGFDATSAEILPIRVRPLIAMECTVIAKRYMNLGTGEAALAKFTQLRQACRAVEGCFTILWHNTQLESKDQRRLYEAVLS